MIGYHLMGRTLIRGKIYRFWWVLLLLLIGGAGYWLLERSSTVPAEPEPTRQYLPVKYSVEDWKRSQVLPKMDTDALKVLLGSATTTAEVLDFQGGFARQYRYTSKSEPPLYVIESDKLFEVAWYYANQKDDEQSKTASVQYAQKVYQVITAIYGDKGTTLTKQLLSGEPLTKKQQQAYPHLVFARCQDYLCQVVINKH